jgi:hypothetical protein
LEGEKRVIKGFDNTLESKTSYGVPKGTNNISSEE